MFSRFFVSLFILCFFSLNVAANSDNPFAKNESVDIGKDSSWKVDKKAVLATKTGGDSDGNFYHLQFNNKQIKLVVSTDAAGKSPKGYSNLEVHDVQIDGVQNPVFNWCLNNQDKHNRFLQQGLSVKKNICVVNGGVGSFVMSLNKDTLVSLQKGSTLSIELKPYRTPLVLSFDISDFKDMYTDLNAKTTPVTAVAASRTATAAPKKKCKASAPAKYKNIPTMEYDCNNTAAKNTAEASIATLVSQEKTKEQKLAAEKEKQRKLAEEKKLAEQLQKEELLQVEAAALAASEAKQAQIGDEIADKMISMCQKYWDKGEHRCYCQKYIDRAPSEIQANSTCN